MPHPHHTAPLTWCHAWQYANAAVKEERKENTGDVITDYVVGIPLDSSQMLVVIFHQEWAKCGGVASGFKGFVVKQGAASSAPFRRATAALLGAHCMEALHVSA